MANNSGDDLGHVDTLHEEYQSFIQLFSQKGIFSDAEMKEVVAKIIGDDNLSAVIQTLNNALNQVEQKIQPSTCELSGKKYWMLVSTVIDDSDDEVEVEAEDDDDSDDERLWFSRAKLELLKLICHEIITSDSSCISTNDCLNLVTHMENKLSRGDADKFLKQIIKGSWLYSSEGNMYLGVRSITELMPYFKSNHPDLKSCHLCKQTVFYGKKCQSCDKKMHVYCLSNFIKINGKNECPHCNHILGEQPMTQNSTQPDRHRQNETANGNHEPTPGPSTRRRRRRHIDDDE
ncbi:non-structural maintenance of chromosomes element 1 homolog [Microplitis mediator]|uniref:non-structural maintenance of chromosomes element 1 homolog n=1 Tax=Microplitis mediator TaxID=375433 RepID=UPI002552AC36|nr:non-structural maintenance of chromosomes element 1 homolog [Microplitis mediator]